jgi:hypothetical protein
MHGLVLLQVAAAVADTFHHSAADSVLVYGALAGAADRFAWWKALPFSVQAMILGPIISVLFHVIELGLRTLGKKLPWLAGAVQKYEDGGGALSGLKAALVWAFGFVLTGNIVPGIIGSGFRSVWVAMSKPSTAAGLAKAKTVALVLGSLLALSLASPGMAAEPNKEHYGLLALGRFSLSPGLGYRWERHPGTDLAVPYWDVRLGYTVPYLLPDHVKIDGRYGHNIGAAGPKQSFVEARLGLVF